jgi:hypothetical protein
MAGFIPAIHAFGYQRRKTWITRTSPVMTNESTSVPKQKPRIAPGLYAFLSIVMAGFIPAIHVLAVRIKT